MAADRSPASGEQVDATPDTLWSRRVGRGTVGLPAMGDTVTLIATVDRWLYAVETRTGRQYWRRRGDAPFGPGPLVVDGLAITATEGTFARLTATRVRDGKRRWQVRVGDLGGPLVADSATVYGATTAGVVFAAALRDGDIRWRREIGATRSTPVLLGDRLAVVTATDSLATLERATGRLIAHRPIGASTSSPPTRLDDSTIVLTEPDGAVIAVAVPSGERRWTVRINGALPSPAILARDTVWALTTGCTLWRIPRDGAAPDSASLDDCVTRAAPTVLRDGVLVASVRGEVIFFDPRTRSRVFTRRVRGALQHPALVRHGQILVAPSFGDVVSFQ